MDLKSDVTQIQDIAAERTEEVREANRLVTNALPGGGVLKSQLITALLISLNIDTEYLAWAQQQQSSGCSVGTDSAPYEDATSLDAEATADKTEFCNTWNAVAIEYGLTEFSAGQI